MNLKKMLAERDVKGIAQFCKDNNLTLEMRGNQAYLVPIDEDSKISMAELSAFYDSRQQCRKILLNSLYGALLNEGMRLADERMGQSVTLTGRSIARHMNSEINRLIEGEYSHTGAAICYADTDSSYFTAASKMGDDPDRQLVLDLYLQIGDEVNKSFPPFMDQTFHTGLARGSVIAAGLELVASKALFIKKKKYACLKMWDDDSKWLPAPGKLKAMGLDLKRADTPEAMQNFLKHILMDILQGAEEKQILTDIADFRLEFNKWQSWQKGSPKKVNNLTKYSAIKKHQQSANIWGGKAKEKKATIPQQVEGSLNWNRLLDIHHDKYSMRCTDGSRIVVCKLKPNHLHMKAVAYPVDEPHLPKWFKELPFDDALMEQTIIDKKIANLIAVLGWNLKATKHSDADEFIVF